MSYVFDMNKLDLQLIDILIIVIETHQLYTVSRSEIVKN